MKIIFFDSNLTLLSKNFLQLANYFYSQNSDIEFLFVSCDIAHVSEENEKSSNLKIQTLPNSRIVKFKSFNNKKIKNFLIMNKPDFLFIDCYRLIDQLWVCIAKELHVKTILIQHGFELDSAYYKIHTIFTKFSKGIRITMASISVSKVLNVSPLVLFYQYLIYIYLGKVLKNTHLGNPKLFPDRVFLYSEYYKSFFNRKYGFPYSIMTIIKYPDLNIVPEIEKQPLIKGICYISQTLVEDGRMKRKQFEKILNDYMDIARKVDYFYVKLHPRGNKNLYKSISTLNNVKLINEFPHCEVYLTHYSSMAFVAAFISNNIILHQLPGHPTPSVYKSIGSKIVTSSKDIMPAICDNKIINRLDKEKRRKDLNEIVYYDEGIDNNKIIYNIIKELYP